jgi:hypothetical protein
MMIFKRTPTITLDCVTYLHNVNELTPIIPAVQATPDWWKSLKRGTVQYDYRTKLNPTAKLNMKSCSGFLELYKRGAIMESWSDFNFTMEHNGLGYFYSTGEPPVTHPINQRGNAFRNYHHLKLASPWHFREKTGAQFFFGPATWSLENSSVVIMPGVMSFDVNHSTNVNMMLPNGMKPETIKMGTPLIHLIPLCDKRLVIKTHVVSREEFHNDNMIATTYYGWRAVRNLLARNKERKNEIA